jgi:hypothetical protein
MQAAHATTYTYMHGPAYDHHGMTEVPWQALCQHRASPPCIMMVQSCDYSVYLPHELQLGCRWSSSHGLSQVWDDADLSTVRPRS